MTKTKDYLSPLDIPAELFARYEKSGPRYTSYPTAPQFTMDFDRDSAAARWQTSNTTGNRDLSLYLHIPFCRSRCSYCGCYTIIGQDEAGLEAYTDALLAQADQSLELLDPSRSLTQLALGGGTPTFLGPDRMTRLIQGLRDRFNFAAEGERAIEVDPRSINPDFLDVLVELGFNRFSFGLQDLDPLVQERINRVMDYHTLEGLLNHLRKRGRDAINLDLIYGLPGQTRESFTRTMEQVLALGPTRLALFGYAHVPWVSDHQKSLEAFEIPGPQQRMELFGTAFEMLLDAGWKHVGMDHFARPGDELLTALESRTLTRSFMGYTTRKGQDLVGIGASAISSVGDTYTQNVKGIKEFQTRSGRDLWVRGYVMDREDVLRREVILDLMCNFYLDIRAIEARFGLDFQAHFQAELAALNEYVPAGMIRISRDELQITELGRFFVRNLAMVFDTYLKQETGLAGRYSKTI